MNCGLICFGTYFIFYYSADMSPDSIKYLELNIEMAVLSCFSLHPHSDSLVENISVTGRSLI